MSKKLEFWAQLPVLPNDQLVAMVSAYEAAGVAGIWSSQTFAAPFVPLSAAASVSKKLALGSGIALAFVRSPLETALNAMALDTISNGRCVLGLGSSAASLNEAFGVEYGKPLAHMREVIGLIRQVIAKAHTGELGVLAGEYHKLDLTHFRTLETPVRTEIPIYLPAVFEKAVAMSGELADGLLAHPLWADSWIHNQLESNLKAGLDKAGRERSDVAINLQMFVAINDDKQEAINDSRANIAYYSQSPQYLRYFDAIGFGKEARAIQDAFARNAFDEMTAACTDEMVEAIALVGSKDEVRKRLLERTRAADACTPTIPHVGLSPEKAAFYNNNIAETFYN
jgi:probable F420-dependent oxidoreductase